MRPVVHERGKRTGTGYARPEGRERNRYETGGWDIYCELRKCHKIRLCIRLYTIIALYLVKKVSPKTFKLK